MKTFNIDQDGVRYVFEMCRSVLFVDSKPAAVLGDDAEWIVLPAAPDVVRIILDGLLLGLSRPVEYD